MKSYWERPLAPLWICVFVTAVFLPTLWFTQVGLDDPWLWADDSPLRSLSLDTLHHVFFEFDARARHDIGTEYLPIRDLVVAFDMAVWGDSFRGPHATQLVLYLATIVGVGRLLVRLGLRADVAWIAALVFAIHPLHVEAVAWISERKGILAALFVVATGHAWISYRDSGRVRWLVAAAACAICATWSKAPAMFGPLAYAAIDLCLLPAHRRRWITIVVVGSATALAALPVVLIARDAGVVDNAFTSVVDSRPIAAVSSLGHYVLGLVTLREPSVAYRIQTAGGSPLDLLVGGAALLAAIALVSVRGTSRPWRRALVAWAAVWFIPISHLLTRVHIVVADRYVYLWILAACVGIAALLARLRGPVRLATIGLVVGLLSIRTFQAQEAWTGGYALAAKAFASNPDDRDVCLSYAKYLFMNTRPVEALAVIDRGLEANPDDPYLHAERAYLLGVLQLPDEAFAASARAAATGHASVMYVHAGILAERKQLWEALAFAQRAAIRRPEANEYAWRRIGILGKLGRFHEAMLCIHALQQTSPGSATEMVHARLLIEWRRYPEAEAHFALARAFGADESAIREAREEITAPRP